MNACLSIYLMVNSNLNSWACLGALSEDVLAYDIPTVSGGSKVSPANGVNVQGRE